MVEQKAVVRYTMLYLIITCDLIVPARSGHTMDGDPDSRQLDGLQLGQTLWQVANDGMGLKGIQEKYDQHGTFTSSVPDWKVLVEELAEETGKKFGDTQIALDRLRTVTEEYYDKTSNAPEVPLSCCSDDLATYHLSSFNTKVNQNMVCSRVAPDNDTIINLPVKEFLTVNQENLQNYPFTKWQYMGTEEGTTLLYPAFKTEACVSYDPRFRPWYVEAYAPTSKDIVIVVDGTDNRASSLSKRSVLTIISTTNSNDRIAVIKFGQTAQTPPGDASNSTCFKTKLALATPRTKEYLKWFVSQSYERPKDEAALFYNAFKKAFVLFKETNSEKTHQRRKRVLLFFTDSNPNDAQQSSIISLIKDKNANLKEPATILIYASGPDILPSTVNLLQSLAEANKGGKYTFLESTKNLRYNLGSYYDIQNHPANGFIFILPYFDLWGLGVVLTIAQPFYMHGEFKGIIAIDCTLREFLSHVTDIRQGIDAYTFIVDGQGRTIYHPFITQPDKNKKDNLHIHISMLERGDEIQQLIPTITSGVPGGQNVRVTLPKGKVAFPGQWVQSYQMTKHYQWTKIPNTGYILCIVSTGRDAMLELEVDQSLRPNYVNVESISPTDLCYNQGRLSSTLDHSVVYLEEKVYKHKCSFSSKEDEVQRLTIFFSLHPPSNAPECIKDYVYDEVLLSGSADHVWNSETSQKYNQVLLSRHLLTVGGVRRAYPAVPQSTVNPLTLPWYVKPLIDIGRLVLTRGINGNRTIFTMSHVIYEGRKSQLHTSDDLPVAVLAAEFTYAYFRKIVNDSCHSSDKREASCILVDESGVVLIHSDQDHTDNIHKHIIDTEPSLAKALIQRGILLSGKCINAEQLMTQTYWKVSPTWRVEKTQGNDLSFEIHAVPKTNIFLIQKYRDISTQNDRTSCTSPCVLPSGKIHKCSDLARTCNCSCVEPFAFNYCTYIFPSSGPHTCPLTVLPMAIETRTLSMDSLPEKCPQIEACNTATSRSDCALLPSCFWCSNLPSDAPRCSRPSECNAGGSSTPVVVVTVVIVLLLVAIGIIILLWFLHRQGRLKQLQVCVRKGRGDESTNVPERVSARREPIATPRLWGDQDSFGHGLSSTSRQEATPDGSFRNEAYMEAGEEDGYCSLPNTRDQPILENINTDTGIYLTPLNRDSKIYQEMSDGARSVSAHGGTSMEYVKPTPTKNFRPIPAPRKTSPSGPKSTTASVSESQRHLEGGSILSHQERTAPNDEIYTNKEAFQLSPLEDLDLSLEATDSVFEKEPSAEESR